MKQYYYEKMQKATLKLEIARVGYHRKMDTLASKLLKDDASLHGPIVEAIVELRKALDEMVAEALDYKAKYQAECDKEALEGDEVCSEAYEAAMEVEQDA
jgi:hypothetical protein